jgi:hypothetical protein
MIRTIIRKHPPAKPTPIEDRRAPYIPALIPKGIHAATFVGPISGTPRCFVGKGMPLEVMISDTASILIEGRGNQTLHWIEVATLTNQGQHIIPAMTEMRATVRRNTGAVHVIQRP